jgi:hypothetical protein
MVDNIDLHNNMNHFSVKHQTVMVNQYCVRFDRGMVHIAVAGYIVHHYCLMFDRGVVHIVVAVILLTITVSCLTEEWSILLWLAILLTITVLGVR